jgi:hypothetical protein
MTPENFTYWLQGYFEISGEKTLDAREVQIIKDHLDLVFKKVTPDAPKEDLGWQLLDTKFTGSSSLLLC